jgi:hypothetical protein
MHDVFASSRRACLRLHDLAAKAHMRMHEPIAMKPVEDRCDVTKVFVFPDAMKFCDDRDAIRFAAAGNRACKPKRVCAKLRTRLLRGRTSDLIEAKTAGRRICEKKKKRSKKKSVGPQKKFCAKALQRRFEAVMAHESHQSRRDSQPGSNTESVL